MEVTAAQVRAYRVHAQQLDRATGTLADTAVLRLGVQDSRPDGAVWSLAVRGVEPLDPSAVALIWSWRGAPHLVRRADLPAFAAATRPYSAADAAKRIFDASRPLKAAGIAIPDALAEVAAALRTIVTTPTPKGDVSTALTAALPEPYRRWCNPCQTIHLYEQPFRLSALPAGLELEPGTSPPVLRRIPRFRPLQQTPVEFDPIGAYLHLLGPATPRDVAGFLDAPVQDVKAHWPADVVEVRVDDRPPAALLEADVPALAQAEPGGLRATRLLAPADPMLQARDRDVLVGADPARQKTVWPTIGRPGVVLAGADVVGSWRARKAGAALGVEVTAWAPLDRRAVEEQAQRVAAARGLTLAGVDHVG